MLIDSQRKALTDCPTLCALASYLVTCDGFLNVASLHSVSIFTQAADSQERRERERRQEEENNQTDILNQLQGDLLDETPEPYTRGRRDCYKGMTLEQYREYTMCQREQAAEKRVSSTHRPEHWLLFLND